MKILSIVSSYRKNGNTSQIVNLIHEGLQNTAHELGGNLELETLFIGHMNLQPCQGCRRCFNLGHEHCPINDDVPAIKAKIKAAGGILFASPVYIADINGIMKNLLDRLAYICHRPEFADKCVQLIATSGTSSTRHALYSMGGMISWGFTIVGRKGFLMGARMKKEESKERFTLQTQKIARTFFQAIHEKKFSKPSIVSLMIFQLLQRNYQRVDAATLDYQYWYEKGWTDPNCHYYLPHKTNHLKLNMARLASLIVRAFV